VSLDEVINSLHSFEKDLMTFESLKLKKRINIVNDYKYGWKPIKLLEVQQVLDSVKDQ
jgi:hypothetical protein